MRARQHHLAALGPLPEEAQLGRLHPAQRQLLVVVEGEAGPLEVDGVAEPPVVQPDPALALEALDARPARGVWCRWSAAELPRPAGGQVQRALDGQLGGVQREPARTGWSAVLPRRLSDTPIGGAAQAQLAVRLQHLGLEVLADGHAVAGDRAARAGPGRPRPG